MGRRVVLHGPVQAFAELTFPRHQLAPAALMLVSGVFTADATVGTRQLFADVMSPEGVSLAWVSLGQVTAGETQDFTLASSFNTPPAYGLEDTAAVVGGVPCCGLWEGCTVRLYDFAAVSAGDQWASCVMGLCVDD